MKNKNKKVELNLTNEELLLLHNLVYYELKYHQSENDDIDNNIEQKLFLSINKKLNHYLFSHLGV